MNFDLFKFLDAHVARLRFKPNVDTSHFYPSEASVKYYDKHGDLTVAGNCMRASYFRVVGGFEKLEKSAYTQWIFKMGKAVEDIIIEQIKESGIWVDNNVKFYNKEFNVSGEIDLLVREPHNNLIIPYEVKSAYGYYATREIFGNKSHKAFPKLDQMIQLLVYLNEFKDQFPYGRMVYFFRDSTKRKTFKISLHQEGDIIYPVIDDQVFKLFTINDILARYKELQGYIDRQEVPLGDYELQYSEAKIHDFKKKDKISKTKYENWQKGKLKPHEYVGDWRCGYCDFRKVCHPDMVDGPEKEHL